MKTQAFNSKNLPVSRTPRSQPAASPLRVERMSPAPKVPPVFRVAQPYEGFHVGQTVFLYQGPTYGVDVPGEIAVTVTPNQGPFVGLRPEFLERLTSH